MMPLRTYARPKPSALGLRSGMSASTVAKSNACTKPLIIRCASLSSTRRSSASYGWFTEGFDTRDLKEAKALLEELA